MTNLTEAFLTGMLAYGPLALALALMIGALGLPVPGTMLLLAAGAFARQGVLDWLLVAPLALLGVVVGDSSSYLLGRYGGRLALKWIENSTSWQEAQKVFDRRGGLAILLTRFLVTPLAVPINLIAGSSQYALWRFLIFDISGELVWVALYSGLGYLFAQSWEALNDLAGNLSGLLVGIVILGIGGYLIYRQRQSRSASQA